ncbi:hypothetical protein CapIbe_013574 [Capra ibex]
MRSLIPPLQDMKCKVITVSSHGLPELVHQLGRSQHTRYLQGDVSTFKTSSTVRLPAALNLSRILLCNIIYVDPCGFNLSCKKTVPLRWIQCKARAPTK